MKVRYAKGSIHPDASNIMECLRMFKNYDDVRQYLMARYPEVGSGMYATVYGISDDVVLKLSTPDDFGFHYCKAVVHGTLHRKIPQPMHQYLPKMYGIGFRPHLDMHDESGFYVVPMERLTANEIYESNFLDDADPQHRTIHLMEMFQDSYSLPYQGKKLQTYCLRLEDLEDLDEQTLRYVVRAANRHLFKKDVCTKQEVQFLQFARLLQNSMSTICASADLDLHSGNIMIRETDKGTVLVVTDPVA